MNLVIVESPAKGKTIEKYLGKDYKVLASFGHVRDLPSSKIGVDVEHDFTPEYRIIPRAKKTITGLKAALKTAKRVYLATDFDREGEAIAWHLIHALDLEKGKNSRGPLVPVERITFHEITKDAIVDAVAHPRPIDMDLVHAQQGRRLLDRLVGYKLSPFLWKKVMSGLSAGRVQSVAVRLIVDREREIEQFVPSEYWTVTGEFTKAGSDEHRFSADLLRRNGEKLDKLAIKNAEDASVIESALRDADYRVEKVETKDQQKWASPPFTTSTLQQEASRRLGFSAKRTMRVAQMLYEAGRITYMRTDSTNLADVAVTATRALITKEYGDKYLPSASRQYKTKSKGAQEAHEAIRPTVIEQTPSTLVGLSDDEHKLYDLIWRRMVACQMQPAILAVTKIAVLASAGTETFGFAATGSMVKFDGYLRVWPTKMSERELPPLTEGDSLDLRDLRRDQHFTEPPARYNEASLIKVLEEYGIGRPSTYAPTIATIVDRGYVRVERRVFYPQEIGTIVTDLLKEHFPEIVDVHFTAEMEERLDSVAEGKANWVTVLRDFYTPFARLLEQKMETVQKQDLVHETTDEVCEKCGKPMQVKLGRFGKFLACTGFPDCRNTKPIVVATGVGCPICEQGELVERRTRFGKVFWSCNRYPDCKAATWDLNKPATLPDPSKVSRAKRATKKPAKKPARKQAKKK